MLTERFWDTFTCLFTDCDTTTTTTTTANPIDLGNQVGPSDDWYMQQIDQNNVWPNGGNQAGGQSDDWNMQQNDQNGIMPNGQQGKAHSCIFIS